MFLAVCVAAFLHAAWNALVKGGGDKYAAMTAVVLGHAPFALALLPFAPRPDAAALPFLVWGIALHLGYQLFLAASYRVGDLSHVYPIARGSAPLIVAVVSVALLGVTLHRTEWLAVMLIALGLFGLAAARSGSGARNPRAVAFALATGVFIASYSLVDGLGARAAGAALGYWCWAALGNAVLFTMVMTVWQPAALRSLGRDRGLLRLGLIGGGASFAAYGIVIWAFTQAPIALVTALRETSIVFALLIGVLALGERLSLAKLFSTLLAVVGAAALRLAR